MGGFDLAEPVSEPTEWANPLIIVEKPKSKLPLTFKSDNKARTLQISNHRRTFIRNA